MSGKDLADKVGLSQSALSRLESGKRGLNTLMLSKLARALGVHPSHFFPEFNQAPSTPPASRADSSVDSSSRSSKASDRWVAPTSLSGLSAEGVAEPVQHIGRLISQERRKLHLRADELGAKIGKGKAWVLDLERGAVELLTGKMLGRVAKALKLDPSVLYDAQRGYIKDLHVRLKRMEQAYADSTRGQVAFEDGQTRAGIPVLGSIGESLELGSDGFPTGEVQDYVLAPDLTQRCVALIQTGEDMNSASEPSFSEGECLIFSLIKEVRHRDFSLVATESRGWVFRQVFFDPRGVVRLQPLNLNYAPLLLHQKEVKRMFRLEARIQRFK